MPMEKNNISQESKPFINFIADSVERRFEGHPKVKEVADDIRHSLDGYMEEREIGAMIVDLIKTLAEDQNSNQK